MRGDVTVLPGSIELLTRADLLSLRNPDTRGALHARFMALRKAMRNMGFDPEVLDHFEYRDRKLAMVEKIYVMLLAYCGLNHEQALTALMQACGVNTAPSDVKRRASIILRSVDRTFVAPALQLLLRDAERVMDFSPERTLEEVYHVALGNITDVVEVEGGVFRVKDLSRLPRSVTAQIASIKRTEGRDGTVSWEVKLNDKVRSLELLMKHFGLLTEKIEVTVDQTLADRIDRARKRVFEGEIAPGGLLEHDG